MPKKSKAKALRIPPPKGYHFMPDGSLMKDSKMKKKAPKSTKKGTKKKGTKKY